MFECLSNSSLVHCTGGNHLGYLFELVYVRAECLASRVYIEQSINYRPFVVFLLPRLSHLDNVAITRDVWAASRSLFCEKPGVLSEALMTLLQPGTCTNSDMYANA